MEIEVVLVAIRALNGHVLTCLKSETIPTSG